MMVVDILNPTLTTAIGDGTLTPRQYAAHAGVGLGYDTEVGVRRWNLQCSDIGLSLSRPSDAGRYRKEKGMTNMRRGCICLSALTLVCHFIQATASLSLC